VGTCAHDVNSIILLSAVVGGFSAVGATDASRAHERLECGWQERAAGPPRQSLG